VAVIFRLRLEHGFGGTGITRGYVLCVYGLAYHVQPPFNVSAEGSVMILYCDICFSITSVTCRSLLIRADLAGGAAP